MEKRFYKGKKVLITGHTGFKGAWLSLVLNKLGAQVFGYALNPHTNPNLYGLLQADEFIDSCIDDIRNFERLKNYTKEVQPEIIIHLAAQSLVRPSYRDPRLTYETNVMGTVNLLEAARKVESVRVILNVTTDKCYENKEWVWGYRENDLLGGHDPYSNSKACSEMVTASYREAFYNPIQDGIVVATARSGNIIGGGDWSQNRLVPDFIRSMQAGEEVVIRNPNATRPWQFILDSLLGYLTLVEKLSTEGRSYAESWNFGPGDENNKTVEWIIDQLCQNWSGKVGYRMDLAKNVHEANFLKLDSSKAKTRLNWSNNYSLEEGLEKTMQWYKEFFNGRKARELCEFQIDEFLNQNSTV